VSFAAINFFFFLLLNKCILLLFISLSTQSGNFGYTIVCPYQDPRSETQWDTSVIVMKNTSPGCHVIICPEKKCLKIYMFLSDITSSGLYPVGIGTLSPGLKRPGRDADPLPQYSAEVKNAWSYASFFNTFSRNGAE
jgi:hypothetical protein